MALTQMAELRANTNTGDTIYALQLKPYGRYLFNDRNELELISSAAHFKCSFQGDECRLFITAKNPADHNYIQFELDGIYQKRIVVRGSDTGPIVIQAKGKGKHTIAIYKATEAHTGAIIISKLIADHIQIVAISRAPLFEFIGNSITCGAAADTSDFPCGVAEYHDYHNAYMAYGPRVARALGVNYILSSVSGIGIYRTWNMDGPSMPQVYEHIDFQLNNPRKWDFKIYSPKIVSIALGTNDLSNGDGKTPRKPFDKEVFISDYVQFVKLVKTKYPVATIALLSSPMVKGESGKLLETCLLKIKNQIDLAYPLSKPVQTFFFPPMDPHGCSGHPSIADHLILAKELRPFFKKMMN